MQNDDQNFISGFYKDSQKSNEIIFDRIGDECFVFAQGFEKNAKYVASEIAESAILAHKVLRKKQFYFAARLWLLKQQYNVVIRKLLRIKKQKKFTPLASLTMIDCSDWSYWVNIIGEDRVFLYRDHQLKRLLPKKLNQTYESFLILNHRDIQGLQMISGEHHAGDMFMIINKPLSLSVNEKRLENILESIPDKDISLDDVCKNIVLEAKKRRTTESYAVFIAKVLRNNPK